MIHVEILIDYSLIKHNKSWANISSDARICWVFIDLEKINFTLVKKIRQSFLGLLIVFLKKF